MTSQRRATLALIAATFFWGAAFTWAKAGGETINRAAGMGVHSAIGPIFLLSVRFLFSGLIWLAVFPESRRGWTFPSFLRGAIIGLILAVALAIQHLGLDRSSEAVSAFLISLTVLFVPILVTVAFGKPPRAIMWFGVIVATAGIWLMTGAAPTGFGIGEILGLACAVVFSVYILAVNAAIKRDSPWRMTAAQFLVVGTFTLVWSIILLHGDTGQCVRLATLPSIPFTLLLLILFPTLYSYGSLTHFQPRIDPTRAVMLYLLEPIFASAYAWIVAGKSLTTLELIGAGLILSANGLVELAGPRKG